MLTSFCRCRRGSHGVCGASRLHQHHRRAAAAAGTEKESAEAKKYVAELEADIMPIDNLIGFASSDAGMQYFGADTAKGIVTHANEIKAAGAKYCDCPACAAVEAILEKKELLLK